MADVYLTLGGLEWFSEPNTFCVLAGADGAPMRACGEEDTGTSFLVSFFNLSALPSQGKTQYLIFLRFE